MTIKKYTGKTREEAIEAAKSELGSNVVIMNVKEVRPSGILSIFKASTYEVTAAVEEDRTGNTTRPSGVHFDAVAGEKGVVEKNDTPSYRTGIELAKKQEAVAEPTVISGSSSTKETDDSLDADSLRDAFRAVNEVIQSGTIEKTQAERKSENSTVLRETEATVTSNLRSRPTPSIKEDSLDDLPVNLLTDSDQPKDNRQFVRMLYKVLLDNEVEERDVNQLLGDLQKVIQSGSNIDVLLSNVYQKMVLMLGQPRPIQISKKKPTIVFFIGPTGVGKTTTIAKLAYRYKWVEGRDIALFSTDTFRIAAEEQLKTYANIIETPTEVINDDQDINEFIERYLDKDLILVDTTGFSHKNQEQKEAMKKLLNSVSSDFTKDVYLTLSATTRFRDMKDIIDCYREFTDFHLIFTKLDETSVYGPIFSGKLYADADLSYVTRGQNVPDDIELIDIQKMVRTLLGGR